MAFILLIGVISCTDKPLDVFPDKEWEYDTSKLPPRTVNEAEAFLRTLETTGLMVVQGGKVIYEYGDVAEVSYVASVRKSILSMLYGAHVASGEIRLDATLKELEMSDVGGLFPTEQNATVFDLITARSGIYHSASNSGDLLEYAPTRGSKTPGTYWLYNNWDFNAAGSVFESMTGKNIYDAIYDELAIPILMQDFDRQRQKKDELPAVSQHPAYTTWLSTRDMARLGLLMLRNGRWGDRQIIPVDWIDKSTSVITPFSNMNPDFMRTGPFGYGYMWWIWDGEFASGPYKGGYTASGAHGQWITILPAMDMVVVHKTFWSSSSGIKFNVKRQDYYRLLDLLTGNKPATQEELIIWGGLDVTGEKFNRRK
ncbi:MAG: beta-lactamase family protein [Bacteroidales bacterium]|nr:beta-lactamase family protein [Candidatus Neomarinimicrobiota bacterium]MCF8381957.1 beta-lactamase family protein [Bacteroidales bacterium]